MIVYIYLFGKAFFERCILENFSLTDFLSVIGIILLLLTDFLSVSDSKNVPLTDKKSVTEAKSHCLTDFLSVSGILLAQ